jgi:putative membrane protein
LVLSAIARDKRLARVGATFALGCVVVAGIVGAFTAKIDILFVQALPGAIALVLVRLDRASA